MERVESAPTVVSEQRRAALAACALALLSGPIIVLLPPAAVVALLCSGGLIASVALRPEVAAYVVLAATPLTAGIERGVVMPLLRPSEAILLLVAIGLAARGVGELLRGASWRPFPSAVEWSLLVLAFTGSVIPLLWMVGRGREVTVDDLFYASYLWKYAAVFLVVRVGVRTERHVRVCLWISIMSATIVGLIAVLQSLRLFGVPGLLAAWYSPSEAEASFDAGRGTSTVSSSFAVADIMVVNLAMAAGWLFYEGARRRVLVAAALMFLLGTIAAAQFSGFLALGIGIVTVGMIVGRLGRFLVVSLPATAAAVLLLWPVVERRLAGFGSPFGLPPSWVAPYGRLDNLSTFFWPELLSDFNWLTGVRVAARVRPPEPWRDWVWIESGHTWLLWSGGVVFFAGCFAFLWIAIRTVAEIARRRADTVGVAAIGSLTALWINVVLMTFDVHLTLRGSADLTFALLALALVGGEGQRSLSGRASRRGESET